MAAKKTELKEGNKAPVFSLMNQDKKTAKLSDFKGKWVVLYFYPKDNTSGCTLEAVDFPVASKSFENMNAIILGVSPDSVDSHCKFIDKHNLGIMLLSDPDQKALKAYGVWQKKSMYGKSFMGVVRSTFLIDPDGKIQKIWRKVKVPGHVDEVKQVLKELQK